MQKALRILFPICALVLGWIGYGLLSKEPEKAKRPVAPVRVIKTKVLDLVRQDYQTVINTQGVVRAHNEATLTAQVSGKVASIAPELQDGAFFEKDDVLLEIDPEDLAAGVVSAEAELARAMAAYAQEEARAKQAKLNWEDLGYDDEPNELVLRLPQLREAKANVEAAEANLDRAKRDLSRAVIRAPFDGRVLQRSVSLGQSITSSSVLATIFNTDFVEVRLPIASRQLASLNLPESQDDPPVDVELSDAMNEEVTATWHGKIVGTEGALDPNSRELFAIALVADPFSRNSAKKGPPLRIGQPVRAAIAGKILDGVFVIPREAVRELTRIALVESDSEDAEKLVLKRLEIEPIWSNLESVIVRDTEIPDHSMLATTRMVYVPAGSPVEIMEDAVIEEDAATAGSTEKPDET
jgi:RND family efflux transporter MFP subunit